MSGLKTIAAYVPDEARAERVFGVASRLAEQHAAHLTGYFVMPPELTVPLFPMGRQLVAAGLKSIEAHAEEVATHFHAAGSVTGVNKDWCQLNARHASIPHTLSAHIRSADVVVMSQRDPTWEESLLLECPEDIVMLSGRPVLMVPTSGQFKAVGRRVLVAWNDRREAARAVFDALPMLRTADQVRVVWVNPNREAQFEGDVPTAGIAHALARHGVKCTASVAYGPDQGVGDTLLNECSDFGADLLVMGAYGHARLREYVFGGATRHILKTMTVPVLLSH